MLKPSAPWGQSSRQLKQTRHSDLRRADCGSEAPWQRWRQSSQLTHFCSSRSIRQRENAGEEAERGSQGAKDATEEAGNHQVHRDEEKEERTDYPGKLVHKRLKIDPSGNHVRGRQDRDGERPEKRQIG